MCRSAVARIAVALLVVAGCGDDGDGAQANGIDLSEDDGPRSESGRVTLPGFEETAVEVTTSAGDLLEWCLLLAAASEQHAQGLMDVVDLGDYAGMLFEFAEDTVGGFWMKDTPMPLTVGYLDAEGGLVSSADMEPCLDQDDDCPSYAPEGPYRWAVEVPQGELGELGLDGEGATLARAGACEPAG
jgi:uncharacterized membrane protein (UPF0127 family)